MATQTAVPGPGSPIATLSDFREKHSRMTVDQVFGWASDAMTTSLGTTDHLAGGASVDVSTGKALVQGQLYENTTTLNISTGANPAANRIDVVALTYDSGHSPVVYARVIQGVSGSGVPPALSNDPAGVWDFEIARYTKTPAGAITITDTRQFTDNNGGTLAKDITTGAYITGPFPYPDRVGREVTFWPSMNVWIWDGTNWSIKEGVFRQTADVVKNNNTTLADLTGLAIPVAANSVYEFKAFCRYTTATTNTPDIKVAWTAPAGATVNWKTGACASNASASIAQEDYHHWSVGDTRPCGCIGATAMTMHPLGYIATAGTGGVVQARFAQNTATAENTTFQAHSYLWVRKIV